MMDVPGVDGTVGAGVVAVVFRTVGGMRCVGVDEPKATTVDFAWRTRLSRAELVSASERTQAVHASDRSVRSVLGLGRNSDWMRLNVDCFGVLLPASIEEATWVVLELMATVANEARSSETSRSIVAYVC